MLTLIQKRLVKCINAHYCCKKMAGFSWHLFKLLRTKLLLSNHYYISGAVKLKRDVIGTGNIIDVCDSFIDNAFVRIRGNNNRLVIKSKCSIGPGCSFWMEGNNLTIIVGENCSFTRDVQLNAQENGMSILIGADCMFSNSIVVRTSDSHPIIDVTSGNRLNAPNDVMVGSHVWVAPNVKLLKGANIGDGSIIGSDTTINKIIPSNSLVVGRPAKIVKSNVSWTRELLF